MGDLTGELLAAVVAAPEERKREALTVLRGEVAAKRGVGKFEFEPFVGLADVAGFLGVSRRSVLRWRVPGHPFGSRTRYRLSEVSAYVGSEGFQKRMAGLREARQAKAERK